MILKGVDWTDMAQDWVKEWKNCRSHKRADCVEYV